MDPFTIQEGETIIARSHAEFGSAHGNYEEFRFFTGLRQSEQFALTVGDCDLAKGTLRVSKARVLGKEKRSDQDGRGPHNHAVSSGATGAQAPLGTARAVCAGRQDRPRVRFFPAGRRPLKNLSYPYDR